MTTEQEKAIEIIDKMIKSYIEADECGLSNNDFKHEIRAMQTVLSMLQEQQEENKKKDKIIDLMEEELKERRYIFMNIPKKEIKQYLLKKGYKLENVKVALEKLQ